MSEPETDQEESTRTRQSRLPPMFGPIENGKRTWISVGAIDYELMGYLLSCHLIIEHYMDTYLTTHHTELEWEGARLTFGQRVALISGWTFSTPFNPIEAIKHLNNLRNRLGHRVDYRLTADDMLPFIHYLKRVGEASGNPPEHKLEDLPPKAILDLFTSIAAAVFAGSVSRTDHDKGRTERNARPDPAQGKEARE